MRNNVVALFQRPEKNEPVLDGIRAIAILMVVCFHSVFFLNELFADRESWQSFINAFPGGFYWMFSGDKGVDLFFILSGYLIAGILYKKIIEQPNFNFWQYFRDRLLRIVPLYAFVLGIAVLAQVNNYEYFWANLLFINNILPFEHILVPWSWSISVEMQFYLLAPLLILLVFHSAKKSHIFYKLLGLLVIAAGIRALVFYLNPELNISLMDLAHNSNNLGIQYWDTLYVNLHTRIFPFICGMALFYLVKSRIGLKLRFINSLLILSFISLLLVFYLPQHTLFSNSSAFNSSGNTFNILFSRIVFSLSITFILFCTLNQLGFGKSLNKILSAYFWFPVSQTSYSIYLFHLFALAAAYFIVVGEAFNRLQMHQLILVNLLAVIISFIIGVITFVLIEKPCLNLKYRKRQNG